MVAHLHICKFSIFRKIYLHMYNFQAKLNQPLALCILTAFFFFFTYCIFNTTEAIHFCNWKTKMVSEEKTKTLRKNHSFQRMKG